MRGVHRVRPQEGAALMSTMTKRSVNDRAFEAFTVMFSSIALGLILALMLSYFGVL